MSTFGFLLTRVQRSLGDPLSATYSRADDIWPWAIEAIKDFPIGRPMVTTITVASAAYKHALPADFLDIITVEYPTGSDPLSYLQRKNHTDPGFFNAAGWYDNDRDYATGSGWLLWTSQKVPAAAAIKVEYLATHAIPTAEGDSLTIEDRYLNFLVQYCVWRAFVESLSRQMLDPTAHTSTIQQMKEAAESACQVYQSGIQAAIGELSQSRVTPPHPVDRYDRIY